MKKLLLIILVVFCCASCVEESPVDMFEITYTVESSQWKLWDDGYDTYFYCEKEEPALTSDMYIHGSFTAYIVKVLNGVESLTPLPYDVYSMDGAGKRWTEQYTCEFSRGYITFIVKVNDFNMTYKPLPATFAVKYIIP